MDKNLHEGHRKRLKERYLKEGIDNFSDHQVLELLLFYSIPYKDTNNIAHVLLKKYGSLSTLFEADPQDITNTPGLGQNSAILLSLIPSLSRRYFKDRWKDKPLLNSSENAGKFCVSLMAGRCYEVFYLLCLDSQNRLHYADMVNEGTLNEAAVYPRLIVESALRHKANSVILAHNHPGGSTKPSEADIDVTKKIKAALNTISVSVIDHIIVSGEKFVSFAEKGLLL